MLVQPILDGEAVMTYCNNEFNQTEIANSGEPGFLSSAIMYVLKVLSMPVLTPGLCIDSMVYQELGGFPNVEPHEAALFSGRVMLRYPHKVKFVHGATVLTSTRRAARENELGIAESLLRRTTAVREEGRIVWGNEVEFGSKS
jgi:hypothetical protein